MNLVAGLGITGQSVLRYLEAAGEPMLAYDNREDYDISELQARYPNTLFATGDLPKAWHKWVTRIILSPGICRCEPWVKAFHEKGIEVVGDIELFARAASQPIVAITGSNGKSTVTTLVGEFLAAAGFHPGVGGNIGLAALDLLAEDEEHDVYVLELSSFQLETTYSLHCASSTVLNISEDHMDRYPGLDAYIQAKTNIYNDTELAVVPQNYEQQFWLNQHVKRTHFCLTKPQAEQDYGVVTIDNQAWLCRGSHPLVKVADMALNAPHNLLNALAAMALCEPFDVSPHVFAEVLKSFKGLAHRTQLVIEHEGVRWFDDSKGTNVGATLAAVQSLGQQCAPNGRIILLAGGVGKEADFSPLSSVLARFCRQVILFGRDAELIEQAVKDEVQTLRVDDLKQAINEAKQTALAGDIVLLSPACASFDQFANYHDRGEKFALWVKQALGL